METKKKIQEKIVLIFILFALTSVSQNVAINGTGAAPNTSAMLDVSSTTSGFLVPRMTAAQKTAIAAPATGLLIYQTTAPAGFWYYDGSAWIPFLYSTTGWTILGNSGTNVTTNFLGTTDANDLAFRVNNVRSGLIQQNGATANSAFGYSALLNNTASYNSAFGYNSLAANTGGFGNAAFGSYAMPQNTTGYYNAAMGTYALYANTGGQHNVAMGYSSLYSNTTGNMNIAHGAYAMYSNTTGGGNIGIGQEAAYSNLNGQFNVAVGRSALRQNTAGDYNVALGLNALYSDTLGDGNIACGYHALYANTTGNDNVAHGVNALPANTTGDFNVAYGAVALNMNTVGEGNTACGAHALRSNTTGSLNSAFGYSANVSAASLVNATAIGANAIVNLSNKVRVGDVNVTSIGGQVGWTTFSDARYKENVGYNVPGLAFITKLKPAIYTVNTEGINAFYKVNSEFKNPKASEIKHSGFLAQDVEKAALELGYDFSGIDKPTNAEGLYGLRYGDFVVPLVKAVQEQQEMIEILKKEIELLKKQNGK